MYKCLNQYDYGDDQFEDEEEEETASINSELIQIYNLCMSSLFKQFNHQFA